MRAGKGDEDWIYPKHNPWRMQTRIQLYQNSPPPFLFYHSVSIFFLTPSFPLSFPLLPSPVLPALRQICSVRWARWFQDELGNLSLLDILPLSSAPPEWFSKQAQPRAGLFPSCGSLNSTYQALTNNQRAHKCHCYVNHCFSNTSSHQVT